MAAPRKYPQELRERAVRLVLEAQAQEPDLSLNAAVVRVGPRLGINKDTSRGWCKQAEIDSVVGRGYVERGGDHQAAAAGGP